jgi:hypothetical protein
MKKIQYLQKPLKQITKNLDYPITGHSECFATLRSKMYRAMAHALDKARIIFTLPPLDTPRKTSALGVTGLANCSTKIIPQANENLMGTVLYFIVLIGATITAHSTLSKAIIWDLNFTLIKENPWKTVGAIGFKPCMLFGLQHGGKSSNLMETTVLDIQKGYKPPESDTSDLYIQTALNPKGNHHQPPLMQDWFAGRKTCEEVRNISLGLAQHYDKYKPNSPLINMFTHENVHQKIVNGSLNWMFNPEEFAKGQKIIEPARRLLKKCATFTDAQGNLKHECYLLSNCDTETFKYLENDPNFEPIFKYIKPEHRFISGKMHCIKPQQTIFECFLKESHLDPKDCIFIDDQEENCREARKIGIDAIELKGYNFTEVKKELRKRGIFEK